MIRTDKNAIEQAERAALTALLKLTKESPKLYNSGGAIERRIPKNSFYGNINSNDVSDLLEEYVSVGLVLKISTRQSNDRVFDVYRANLEREAEIEKILRG